MLSTGELVRALQHNTAVHDAQFSPDGRWLVTPRIARASGTRDRRATSGACRATRERVTAAAFDPTGQTIVTGGVDGTIRTYRCDVCGGVDELLALARAARGHRSRADTGASATSADR